MRKWIGGLATILLFGSLAQGQTTAVTATVLDPNGIPYAGCRANASFVPAPTALTQPLINGSVFPTSVVLNQCDSFANASWTLIDNNQVSDGHSGSASQWRFNIVSQDGKTGFSCTLTITGASQNISAAIQACAAPLPFASGSCALNGPNNALQKKSGPGICAASAVTDDGTNVTNPEPLLQNANASFKGPNPWVDVTRFGARAFTVPVSQTTANCNGTTSVTLASAIDFINGDGIVLNLCGSATALTTPAAPSSITPKGILNGATTRCYEVVAEDNSLGMTAASASTCTSTAASGFGTTVATLTSCALTTGTLSCTTSANHNFEIGTVVRVAGTIGVGGATNLNGIYYIQTTPSGTTFTCSMSNGNRPDIARSTTGGTAEAPAHVWVKWTAQNNVMRSWIYRQDGGAGAFNLVGVMPGQEPFFDDYAFTTPFQPPEVPSTAPAAAANQALATTIVSGAGTTSLVVANAATSTVSGVTALHDDTVAWLAAANGAYTNNGGVVMIPATGTPQDFFILNFPLNLPTPHNNAMVRHLLAGSIFANQPILVPSFTEFDGYGARQTGNPSFNTTTNYGLIRGHAIPMMQIFAGGVTLDHIYFNGAAGADTQQWIVFAGEGNNGAGSAALRIHNSYLSGQMPGGIPLVLRGTGFTFQTDESVYSEGGVSSTPFYYYAAGIRLMGSVITNPTGFWGQGDLRRIQFLGAGVSVDGDSAAPAQMGNGPNNWNFSNIFTEAICAPLFNARNVNTAGWFNWTVDNVNPADQIAACGGNTPILDFSASTVSGVEGLQISPVNAGSEGGTGAFTAVTGLSQGVYINGSSVNDQYNVGTTTYAATPLQSYSITSPPSVSGRKAFESNGAFRAIPPGQFFIQGNPPTNVSATVQAGGSFPIETGNVTVTAVDQNGSETGQSAQVFFTTSTGNQQILVSWTASSPAPAGYNVYVLNSRQNISLITSTSFTITSLGAFGLGALSSAGGPVGMSLNSGVWTTQTRYTSGQFKTDVSASALTANRTVTLPDVSGSAVLGNAISGTGATLCTDASQRATTSGCVASVAIQSQNFTSLSGNVSVGNTATTITSLAVTMPSSGCPCRVRVDYGLYLTFPNTNVSAWAFWVNDGTAGSTHTLASLQTDQSNGATGARTSANAGGYSQVTYANNANVTFTLFGQGTGATTMTVEAAPQVGSGTNSWMQAIVETSN